MASPLRKWSVEVKRAKSSEAVLRLTKKAAGQIDESLIGGIIAIDVSAIGGPETRRLKRCVPDYELDSARERMGEAIRRESMPSIEKAIGDAPVGLVVVHDYVIRPAGRKPDGEFVPWGLHGMWWAFHLERSTSHPYARYREFWDLFGTALPNL